MLLRNLMSLDTEELTTAQPLDILIAIGGCDKTVPAQLMGAISANKPFLPLLTGPDDARFRCWQARRRLH